MEQTPAALSQLVLELYRDLARPTAARVGNSLDALAKIALSPVSLLDWGYSQTRDWLAARVAARLQVTPREFVAAPSSALAVAVVTNVAASHDSPPMCELFAELLLKALDSRSANLIHPSYVAVLAQMSPPEAFVFMSLKKIADENLAAKNGEAIFSDRWGSLGGHITPTIEDQFKDHCTSLGFGATGQAAVWLDNLLRLALLRKDKYADVSLRDHGWERIEAGLRQEEHSYLYFTNFGESFLYACTPPLSSGAA